MASGEGLGRENSIESVADEQQQPADEWNVAALPLAAQMSRVTDGSRTKGAQRPGGFYGSVAEQPFTGTSIYMLLRILVVCWHVQMCPLGLECLKSSF